MSGPRVKFTRGPLIRHSAVFAAPGSHPSAQLDVEEGCEDAVDDGVVAPCDELVELGSPDWLELVAEPVSVGWPARLPVLVGSVAEVDDP